MAEAKRVYLLNKICYSLSNRDPPVATIHSIHLPGHMKYVKETVNFLPFFIEKLSNEYYRLPNTDLVKYRIGIE